MHAAPLQASLRRRELPVDFGGCFAYNAAMPARANQAREDKMAKKKALKKAKKIHPTKPLLNIKSSWK
ncbi:MAG: hypothetical protein WCA00_14775 [Candidatus Acidiferrales bacterium]